MPMPFVLIVLALGLIGGQVTALPLGAGVRVTLLDAAVVAVLIYGAYQSRKKRFIPSLWGPILGFTAVALFSLGLTWLNVPGYVIGGGALYILRWITYAALYWVSANSIFPPQRWYSVLLASGVGMIVIGLLQYVWYPDLRNLYYLGWDPHYQRLFSTLLDPNFAGIVIAVTGLVFWAVFDMGKRTFPVVGGLVLSLLALLLTYSRSSLLAFAVGVTVYGMLMKRRTTVILACSVLAVGLLLLPRTGEGQNMLRGVSSMARVGSAERALTLFREKPLFGHGFNILRFVAVERSWIDERSTPSLSGAGFDTSLLFVGATTGIAGIAVYCWLMARIVRLGIRGLGKKKAIRERAVIYLSVVSAVLVDSIFINSLFYPWIMVWMWVGVGAFERNLTADR